MTEGKWMSLKRRMIKRKRKVGAEGFKRPKTGSSHRDHFKEESKMKMQQL